MTPTKVYNHYSLWERVVYWFESFKDELYLYVNSFYSK